MVGQTEPRTQADELRFEIIYEIGCLPCLIDAWFADATIQHTLDGGQRIGHQASYGSCPYHHQGLRPEGYAGPMNAHVERKYGPSFARNKRAFEQRYGTEPQLVQITDAMVRTVISERRRGRYLSRHERKVLAQQLHREIVGHRPPSAEWVKT